MNAFLEQFGIDWKLFISQLVNFALILFILRLFIYKPLLNLLKKRREKIEEGLRKAEEADVRLKEVDQIAAEKMKQADRDSVAIIGKAEETRKKLETEISARAKKKEEELLVKAEKLAEDRKKEIDLKLQKEAGELIKTAIARAVDFSPEQVDEKLVKKAVSALKEK